MEYIKKTVVSYFAQKETPVIKPEDDLELEAKKKLIEAFENKLLLIEKAVFPAIVMAPYEDVLEVSPGVYNIENDDILASLLLPSSLDD
jgi:sulfur transfer complex TusBCD TusB component (DsrH family)